MSSCKAKGGDLQRFERQLHVACIIGIPGAAAQVVQYDESQHRNGGVFTAVFLIMVEQRRQVAQLVLGGSRCQVDQQHEPPANLPKNAFHRRQQYANPPGFANRVPVLFGVLSEQFERRVKANPKTAR